MVGLICFVLQPSSQTVNRQIRVLGHKCLWFLVKSFEASMVLTTVLLVAQIATVVIPITHEAVTETLARVAVKQVPTAVCGQGK